MGGYGVGPRQAVPPQFVNVGSEKLHHYRCKVVWGYQIFAPQASYRQEAPEYLRRDGNRATTTYLVASSIIACKYAL